MASLNWSGVEKNRSKHTIFAIETDHVIQDGPFVDGALNRIELRLEKFAADAIYDGNCSRVGNVDAFWAGANDGPKFLVEFVVFVWRFTIPDKEEAPKLCIASPRWTGDLGEGWVVDGTEEKDYQHARGDQD